MRKKLNPWPLGRGERYLPASLRAPEPFLLFEFLGPSGVGKTTLATKILSDWDSYKTQADLMVYAHNPDNAVGHSEHEFSSTYATLMKMKVINRLNRDDFTIFTRIKTIEWLCVNLNQDAYLTDNAKGVFLRDDGLYHAFHDEVLELLLQDFSKFSHLLRNRAFILCEAEPDVIVSRVLERENSGQKLPWVEGKSRDELRLVVEKNLLSTGKMFNLIVEENLPHFRFDFTPGQHAELVDWMEKTVLGDSDGTGARK